MNGYQLSANNRLSDSNQCFVKIELIQGQEMVNIKVVIEDVNDNRPKWDRQEIVVEFRDGDPTGTRRQIPQAIDFDGGRNGKIDYELIGEKSSFILIQQEGLYLQTLVDIDHEVKNSYDLTLVAKDLGEPPLSSKIPLKVRVQDINDNAPVFTKTEFRNNKPIPETAKVGTSVLTLSASDRDAGMNGQFHFLFSPLQNTIASKYFKIERNGSIIIISPLDYDRGPSKFVFNVRVEDKPPGGSIHRKYSDAKVILTLSDENDEKPTILWRSLMNVNPKSGYTEIKENLPSNQLVGILTVEDLDYKKSDIVTCEINNKNFTLVKGDLTTRYKLYTATTFDRETTPYQNLAVICSDSVEHKTIKNITLKIGDRNDNAPVFIDSIFTLSLKENQPAGTRLNNFISARDPDEQGPHSQIEYRIAPEFSQNFSVDHQGVLYSRVMFDREACSMYYIRVLAIDGGNPNLTGTATVNVEITDENDHDPTFIRAPYHFKILENQLPGTRVGKVEASDKDSEEMTYITYYLGPELDSQFFRLDKKEGVLTAARKLDREEKAHYTFSVIAKDNGGSRAKSGVAMVNVRVIDVNDNHPVFKVPNDTHNQFKVERGSPLGKEIGMIIATDADEGANHEMNYTIISGNNAGLFSLDPHSGLLFLDRNLQPHDMPIHKNPAILPGYTLVIKACDRGTPPLCRTQNLRIVISGESANKYPYNYNGDGESSLTNNQIVIICLAIIFIVLMVATVVLGCLLKKNSLWSKRGPSNRKAYDANSPCNNSTNSAPPILLENDPSCLKHLQDKCDDGRFMSMKLTKSATLDNRSKNSKNPNNLADYQTLDSLCLAGMPANQRYATCDPANNPLHTYYEISGLLQNHPNQLNNSFSSNNNKDKATASLSSRDLLLNATAHTLQDQSSLCGLPDQFTRNEISINNKKTFKHQDSSSKIYAPSAKYAYLSSVREASFV